MDMREILAVIRRMVDSYYFSTEILSGNRVPTAEDMITAYMRGPYKHHRGRTDTYTMRDLNIWDIAGSTEGTILIGVRVLQWLSKWPDASGGQSVASIAQSLTRFCYDDGLAREAVRHLAHRGFLLDAFRLKNWLDDSQTKLTDDDRFVISPAGKLLLSKCLGKYAFRYLEAVTDVLRRPRLDKGSWHSGKTFDDMIWNVLGMVDLILYGAECELRRMYLSTSGDDAATRALLGEYKATFRASDVIGSGFLWDLTTECCNRAEMLHERRNQANFAAEAETQAYLRVKIPDLFAKAKILVSLQIPSGKQQ